MGVTPNLGAEVDGREDSGSIDPDVMEDIGSEQSDEVERMGVEVGDAGDVVEEVSFNKFLLGYPEFLAAVVDDCVLVRVVVSDEGTGGSGEESRKDVG